MALRKKKVLFITMGVLTLAVCAIALTLLLRIQAFKPQIESAASNALGMDVRINGTIGITLFPDFGISLGNINVRTGGSDVVSIEEMKIALKLVSLTKHEIQILRVELIKPFFFIARHKDGMFNVERPGGTVRGKPFAVKEISISQGNLAYSDEESSEKIEVGDFDMSIRDFSSGEADSAGPYRNISFSGDGRCKILKSKNLTLTDLAMRIAGRNGILAIDPANMNIFGGTGKGSIHVDLTGASPHYRISYTINRFRIEELLREYSLKPVTQKIMEGLIDFSAELTATGKSVDEVKRSLNGKVSLIGEGLVLYNIDIDALISKYEQSQNFSLVDVGAFFLAGPFGPVLTKGYNFASVYEESRGGKGIIRKLVSVWAIRNGIAEATDVALVSKQHRIAMKGGLNFISERFVNVTVAVLDKRGCAVYSEKVHGSFRKPQIEKASIVKSIAGSLLHPLEDAWKFIRGEKCTVFYSGSAAPPTNAVGPP